MKKDVDKKYLVAKEKFKKGDINEAMTLFETITTERPDYSHAYYSLGYAYMEKGEDSKAERTLLQLIALKPQWGIAHLQLGKAYENQQKWEQALTSYQLAIKLDSDNPYAHLRLGIMYQIVDNIEMGIIEILTAYRLGLLNYETIYYLANGLYKLDILSEGLELLNKVIDSNKFDALELATLYNLRAKIHFNLRKLSDAEADFYKAIEISPEYPQFFLDLGGFYFEQDEWSRAIDIYQQNLNLADKQGDALTGIGYAYLKLKKWNLAVEYLEKAREIDEPVFYSLGLAYFELYDNDKAIENFNLELSSNGPFKAEASYYLGFACKDTGDRTSSVRAFKLFLDLSTDHANESEWVEWRTEAQKQISELT